MPPSRDHAENEPLKGSGCLVLDGNWYDDQPDQLGVNGSGTDLLLARICSLVETRVRSAVEEREKANVDEEMKHDWMLAAAVIDRILFITFSFLFVGSISLFFCVFFYMP